jgi:hypothetical protein
MAAAVRWACVVNHSGDESSRGHALRFAVGEVATLSGVDGVTLSVSPRGELLVAAPGAPGVVAEPGRRLELGGAWVELLVSPYLDAGSAPASLTRWSLAFELRGSDRTQPFRFTRATGERFSHGRHDQNVLRFPAPTVARKHTEFFVDAQGHAWAADCQSPGGTWLHAERRRLEGWTRFTPGELLMSGAGVFVALLEPPRPLAP